MRVTGTRSRDLIGISLIGGAIITLLGLSQLTEGTLINAWVSIIQRWFGVGAIVVPIAAVLGGLYSMRNAKDGFRWGRVVAVELLIFFILGLLSALTADTLPEAELGRGGGIVGWSIARVLASVAGRIGRVVLLVLLAGAAGYWAVRQFLNHPTDGVAPVKKHESSLEATASKNKIPTRVANQSRASEPERAKAQSRSARRPELLTILEKGETRRVTAREINRSAGIIEKTLEEFGLPAKVIDFRSGPAVTQFAVEPGYLEYASSSGIAKRNKVRVSQISALANDLALALSASAIRIEAPVPGKAYVGIEVPNKKPALVNLRPILESSAFQAENSRLAIALGRDVAGAPVVADLASMPHLLIAGTTGSGKSVCIASLATSLAINNGPDELKFVMIDPKRVELLRFNGLPHILGKVETDLTRIGGVLRWCTVEMDRRFKLLEQASARDMSVYNKKVANRKSKSKLPRIVVMIDELSDLMMLAPDQTEGALVRLAQMARATGIHLVVATQRPSTDIVTGLIKANFPARIAFAVASAVDSRVILDASGAESLMGRGDMLYLAPDAAAPFRLQGAYASDKDIERLIKSWQAGTSEVAPWEDYLVRQEALSKTDEELDAAIEVVREAGTASASLLQRRLRIGYPRAARLIDELEELGVIGPAQGGGRTREVLIRHEETTEDQS